MPLHSKWSILDGLRRCSYAYFSRWQIFKHSASRAHDGSLPYRNTWCNINVVCDPTFVFNHYGLEENVKSFLLIVMAPGVKIDLMRNGYMTSYRDIAQTIQYAIIADPGVVSYFDFPRISNFDRRPDLSVLSDLGTKEPQEECPPAIEKLWRPTKQRCLNDPPQLNSHFRFASERVGDCKRT